LIEALNFARGRAPERQMLLASLPDLPAVRGDHDKLRMAVNNLVENAVKYSPQGGPVTVGATLRDDDVLLWVRDEGIGVPPGEQERIFERFHRVDTRLSRETPGVGMGLYICKVIAEAHNGRVWVESAGAGQGSTFFLALPRVAA
jgi:signal transduction histidine kinase